MQCKFTLNFVLDPGTGHGVGAALNVHEGPQSISYRYGNLTALQKGMIVSNEPGYYEDNSFGIRIEVDFSNVLRGATVQVTIFVPNFFPLFNAAEFTSGKGA